jgi:hypothetical protein
MTYIAYRIPQTSFILRYRVCDFLLFPSSTPVSLNMNFLTWSEQVCFKYQRAEVAQSVEQGTENPRVSGSIPFLGTSIPGAYSLSRPKRDRPLFFCRTSEGRPQRSDVHSSQRIWDSLGRITLRFSRPTSKSPRDGHPTSFGFPLGSLNPRPLNPALLFRQNCR